MKCAEDHGGIRAVTGGFRAVGLVKHEKMQDAGFLLVSQF
jgi:hypothetical protein